MFSPRWRKVLCDLRQNKLRTALVVLSIAVGVFAVGVITSSQAILTREMTASYEAANPASMTLYTAPFDDEFVQVLQRNRELRAVEGRRNVAVRLKVGPDEWRALTLFAIPDYSHIQVDQVWPERGLWPPPLHEMLIERSALGLTHAAVGDDVVIKTADGKQHTLRVAGLAHDVIQFPAPLAGRAYGYVTFDTLEGLGEPRSFNELHIVVAEQPRDKAYLQQVANHVRRQIEKSGRSVDSILIPTPGKHPADDTIRPILLLLSVLGFTSLLLSGFLVVNTVGAVLAQQIRQIGVMKAVGARTGQLIGMYLGAVLIFGVLALAIAMPLVAFGTRTFTRFIASLINFDIKSFAVPWQIIALEMAVGLIVPFAVAFYPIMTGTRITIREAISGTYSDAKQWKAANKHLKVSGLTHVRQRMLARLISRPVLLSLRNTFRRRGRLMLTLSALTLGGAIFIAVISVRVSLLRTLDAALHYWNYDVEVAFSRPYRIERIERAALTVPGVVKAESWGFSTTRRLRPDDSESGDISLYAPPAGTTLLQPTVLQGRWLLPEDERAVVVNTDFLKDESDVKVGDDLVLKLDGRDTTWRVVGIVQGVLTGPIAYANYPYFARTVREVERASGVRIVTAQHGAGYQSDVVKALQTQFERASLPVIATQTLSEMRARIEFQFNILVSVLLIMALLLAIVGGLGLMGTMSINVLERTREMGVMRAIGASTRAVLQIVMVEGIFIGLLSWLAGSALAVPLSRLLSAAVGQAFLRAPLNYTFSMGGALIWFVAIVMLAGLSSFLPAWNASRLSVRAVLAYE